jgi:putative FmdB family regulatory protein
MPTYEYRCAKCDQHLEVYQSFSEAPLTRHARCGGKLTKVLSPAGIVLKGSGFYKNDSRDSARAKSKARETASGSDTKTESGSDTKSGEGSSKTPKSDTTSPATKEAKTA